MTPEPVAVVITCFELGELLLEAVYSVLAQTVAPAEVLVVDDGSTDGPTRRVLGLLERDEPRITVIRVAHGGPAHVRNVGIDRTSAPLVVLLDGDDLFERTYLARASEVLDERPDLSFVCCALQAFGAASYRWKPPPYTVAEALGRGACGHISTVFRREVWSRAGGFDESLPAYEDVDFWLRALEAGFRGLILDEPLLRYRVRRGSRYHATIVGGRYVEAKRRLLAQHLKASRRGEDVFVTLLDFEREVAGHGRAVAARAETAERSRGEVDADLARAGDELAALHVPRFDWGRLRPLLAANAAVGDGHAIEEHLIRRAVDDLVPEPRPGRELMIRAAAEAGDSGERSLDLLVAIGVLARVADPASAIAAWRARLRSGGRLVVVEPTLAIGEGRERGFTEAALATLLGEAFAAEEVETSGYGNLLTTIATGAGAPLSTLTDEELGTHDPSHPTVVAAAGTVRPRPARFGGRRAPATGSRRGATPAAGARGAILAYHRIADLAPDSFGLCTRPEQFRAHMEMLVADYRPVSLVELVAQVTAGELAPGTVAVTFDDGYLDNYEAASPILTELGIPATFFINGPPGSTPVETWWDAAERILLGGEPLPAQLRLAAGDLTIDVPTNDGAARRAALAALHERLFAADRTAVDTVISELLSWAGQEPYVRPSHRLMTEAELIALSHRPGHTVGSHSVDHLALPTLTANAAFDQMNRCRAGLEALLEQPVEAFAYPYGACDFATASIAMQVGFLAACSTDPDPVTGDSDPLRLPRVELAATPIGGFRLALDRAIREPA